MDYKQFIMELLEQMDERKLRLVYAYIKGLLQKD